MLRLNVIFYDSFYYDIKLGAEQRYNVLGMKIYINKNLYYNIYIIFKIDEAILLLVILLN